MSERVLVTVSHETPEKLVIGVVEKALSENFGNYHPGELKFEERGLSQEWAVILGEDWRDLPPTVKQLTRLVASETPFPDDLTRGKASDLIRGLEGLPPQENVMEMEKECQKHLSLK